METKKTVAEQHTSAAKRTNRRPSIIARRPRRSISAFRTWALTRMWQTAVCTRQRHGDRCKTQATKSDGTAQAA